MFSTNRNVGTLINTEVDTALNTEIPSSNTADSVNDILLDKLEPRLPGSGTLSVLSAANINTQVDDALNTVVPTSNTTNSVNDILLDKLTPRLPSAGTLAVTESYKPELTGFSVSTTSTSDQNFLNITSGGGILGGMSIQISTALSGGSVAVSLDIEVDGETETSNDLWASGVPQGSLRGAVVAHSVGINENAHNVGCTYAWFWGTRFTNSCRVSLDVTGVNTVSGNLLGAISFARRI